MPFGKRKPQNSQASADVCVAHLGRQGFEVSQPQRSGRRPGVFSDLVPGLPAKLAPTGKNLSEV